MFNNLFNRKHGKTGEVGETVTWMIATVIIIVILLISISATVTGIFNFKNFNYMKQTDVLASKSFFSYLLTESEEGTSVYEKLGSEDNLSEFNGELAKDIFTEFYGKEYLAVWIGIFHNRIVLSYESNEYFGKRPSLVAYGITEKVKLNEDKSIEMILKVISVKI